jgi:quinoprotein glucose dehydrogenase
MPSRFAEERRNIRFDDVSPKGQERSRIRVAEGPGFGSAADAPQRPAAGRAAGGPAAAPAPQGGNGLLVNGLSIIKPPYGVISAVNIDKGDITWQVPYGETPDAVRNNPALKGMKIGNTGQPGSVGLMVTKSLVVLGDSQLTTTTGDASVPADKQHPRGAMLRGYDKTNGKEVGAIFMPAPQSGSPMSYQIDGKQYIIVAVSGGSYSGEYIAYALPNN